MRIHYFQHVPFEGLGTIKDWVHEKGFSLTSTRLFDNEEFPDLNQIDWLIIMGGPMGAYEENHYPWLEQEKQFIHRAIAAGKRVLGICLGAQLIANALGEAVTRAAQKEIGWHQVDLLPHPLLTGIVAKQLAFHWHGDTFSIPAKAQRIASSAATVNQAFIYQERVVALQFDLEMTEQVVTNLVSRFANELVPSEWVQTAQQMLAGPEHFYASACAMRQLLENLANLED